MAKNATKHGLFAQQNVIKCENVSDFYNFRQELPAGLAPAGGVEAMLAERIVSSLYKAMNELQKLRHLREKEQAQAEHAFAKQTQLVEQTIPKAFGFEAAT